MDLHVRSRSVTVPALHAIAVVAVVLLPTVVFTRPTNDRVTLEGFVYGHRDAQGRFHAPVERARVSNDWDGTTAVTDGLGRFRISIPRIAADEFLVITVRFGNIESRRRLIGGAAGDPLLIVLPGPR
jgi:hypothetical protein